MRRSLWDLFVSFLSGALVLASLLLHAMILGKVQPDHVAAIAKVPGPILILMALVGPPLIGMLLEPVASIVDDLVQWLQRSLARLVGRRPKRDRRLADLHHRVGSVVRDRHMPAAMTPVVEPYQWCKDYLVQVDKHTPMAILLAKVAFYRNAALVVFVNAAALPLLHGRTRTIGVIAVGLVILAVILRVRSLRINEDVARAIYQHYLIALNATTSRPASPTAGERTR